jgi:hypothetical protein
MSPRDMTLHQVANSEIKAHQIIQFLLSSGIINVITNTTNITNYRHAAAFMKSFHSGQPNTNISGG